MSALTERESRFLSVSFVQLRENISNCIYLGLYDSSERNYNIVNL